MNMDKTHQALEALVIRFINASLVSWTFFYPESQPSQPEIQGLEVFAAP